MGEHWNQSRRHSTILHAPIGLLHFVSSIGHVLFGRSQGKGEFCLLFGGILKLAMSDPASNPGLK